VRSKQVEKYFPNFPRPPDEDDPAEIARETPMKLKDIEDIDSLYNKLDRMDIKIDRLDIKIDRLKAVIWTPAIVAIISALVQVVTAIITHHV